MENKYIITLEEIPFERFHSYNVHSERLYRVQGFNSLVFDGNGLSKLTPYTEPDTNEAYQRGVEDGAKSVENWNEQEKKLRMDEAYQRGLNDAWEAARKFMSEVIDARFRNNFMVEIFECDNAMGAMKVYSASECIDKIQQYEQEQEEQIRVGNEVVFYNGEKCVVTAVVDGQVAEVMDKGGFSMRMDDGLRNSMKKTGRHFPEIAEVLKKMNEETT